METIRMVLAGLAAGVTAVLIWGGLVLAGLWIIGKMAEWGVL